MHCADPTCSAEYVPLGQFWHTLPTVAPADAEYFPRPHSVQLARLVDPAVPPHVPGGQRVHWSDAASGE